MEIFKPSYLSTGMGQGCQWQHLTLKGYGHHCTADAKYQSRNLIGTCKTLYYISFRSHLSSNPTTTYEKTSKHKKS